MKQKFEELSCKELKEELITIITNMDCDDQQLLEIRYLMANYISDPIPDEEYIRGKELFNTNYSNKFRDEFIITKKEINKIIGENWDKKYLHIFFIDDNGDLGILFRFSDIETFSPTNFEIDLNNETAYILRGQMAESFNRSSPSFFNIKQNYKNGVGTKIIAGIDSNPVLTEYVTYQMRKIFLFNGFEQDLKFEVICVTVENKLRLTLTVKVKDSDRVHHFAMATRALFYEGYYDLGDLKP
ncbi:hypothetical protein LF887_02020 [Chryseobacterium sp. MEBOG06]|uniref:hypothetical protein n=1 Tax=Chryseobacterium sp. MEBOG06 TaxID=2879938 RepID=UPI001F361C7E|nr:hypothetical protein [Chryseobacterium sp. MEBOG06]UKB84452.1 hypothetical protein LF887_02020 [Chryseobacterium sp. MEBOG06]